MNRTITVNVVKEFARQDSQNGGIQGSGNVDHLRLRFSEDWDGYAKTCVFWDANGENPVKVIVGADKLEDMTKDPRTYIIDIPPEPLAVEGTYTVVIDGYLDGKRGRSETIRLKSNGAQIDDDAGEPADPTPSQAEQLQQEIEKIIPNIQSVATEAKSWAVGGTGSRDGEDTDNAKYYAQQSEKSAQESAQGLENISQQVEAAKGYSESAKTESLHAANSAQSAAESERSALESSESAKTAESNAKISEQSSAESARQSEEARQAIENMTASAVSVGPDAEPYVKKTSSGGVVNLEFGLRDGEPGPPGYTVPADGLYAFHIDENGDLIITYTGEEIPPFSIDQNGDLIYALAGNEVNIGHVVGGGGTGGTMNYTDLINKPRINGVELVGDKTTAELGIKDGQTPNITIGTVETLPAGSSVTASITGQTPDLVLNLGIPQGQKGNPGQAATVTVGTTTTGAPGSQASVVNSGTPNAAVLDFTIPSGQTGTGIPPTDTAQDGDVPTYRDGGIVWEPPSGGGEKFFDRLWELPETATGSVTLGGDDDPLGLSECFIAVKVNHDEQENTVNGKISLDLQRSANIYVTINSLGLLKGQSYDRPPLIHLKVYDSIVSVNVYIVNTVGDITETDVLTDTNFQWHAGKLPLQGGKIDKICFSGHGIIVFGAGSKFRVWGVKA